MTVVEQVTTWVDVCALDDLVLDRGACALVGPYQVAVFRVSPDGALYALSNYDPFSGAYVLSRGIVGSKGDIRKVASPVYKQGFDLATGRCLENPSVEVIVFPVRAVDGRVLVGLP
jgi:nitrite reductase (NADH) small subunit